MVNKLCKFLLIWVFQLKILEDGFKREQIERKEEEEKLQIQSWNKNYIIIALIIAMPITNQFQEQLFKKWH